MIIARSSRMVVAVFAAGILVGIAHLHTKPRVAHGTSHTPAPHILNVDRRTADGQLLDRNLAYWDSATATAQEIKEMVKLDLQREYGLDEQSEMLVRLLKAVRALQDRKHKWEARIRTTPAPTPHKRPSCVDNPPMHFERTGDLIQECKTYKRSRAAQSTTWIPHQARILSLKASTHPAITSRVKFLESQGLEASVFRATDGSAEFASMYGEVIDGDTNRPVITYTDPAHPDKILRRDDPGFLTSGERGYLTTMKRLIEDAISNGTESLIVLDDDAVMDCSFRSSLDRILNDDRCSAAVRPDLAGPNKAGVLLLGAAIWIEGSYPERGPYCSGWKVTDAELSALRDTNNAAPLCYNAHSKTYGSYAAVYHRSVFRAVLEWIDSTTEPFDHIYPALIQQQKLVRVAYPYLVIQNVAHTSQIDPTREGQHNLSWRANIHRWEPIGRYCDPTTGRPLQHTRR
jgi:hypothetical protein